MSEAVDDTVRACDLDAEAYAGTGSHVPDSVRAAFVTLLRQQGHACDLIDPQVDDLSSSEGPYDAVWANASLLHVARHDLSTVLSRLAAVTRHGGPLRLSVKEGDGEGWSTHGSIRYPRHFTFWRAPAPEEVVAGAGWSGASIRSGVAGKRGETWLELTAARGPVAT